MHDFCIAIAVYDSIMTHTKLHQEMGCSMVVFDVFGLLFGRKQNGWQCTSRTEN
jgi:hypothetical protein